jgi:hypothetical protein
VLFARLPTISSHEHREVSKKYSAPFNPRHTTGKSKSAATRRRFQKHKRKEEEEFVQRKAARPNDYEDSNAQPQQEAPKEPAATKSEDTVKSIAQARVDKTRLAREQAPGKRSVLERLSPRKSLSSSAEHITIEHDGSAERRQELFENWCGSTTSSSEEFDAAPPRRHPIAGAPSPHASKRFVARRTGGPPQDSQVKGPTQAQCRQVTREHRQRNATGGQAEAGRRLRVQRGASGRAAVISRIQPGPVSAQEEEEEKVR